jgi:hypothetical protein
MREHLMDAPSSWRCSSISKLPGEIEKNGPENASEMLAHLRGASKMRAHLVDAPHLSDFAFREVRWRPLLRCSRILRWMRPHLEMRFYVKSLSGVEMLEHP